MGVLLFWTLLRYLDDDGNDDDGNDDNDNDNGDDGKGDRRQCGHACSHDNTIRL